MFSLGDTVICIVAANHRADEIPMPLVLHKAYQVAGLRACQRCGAIFVDVGIPLNPDQYDIVCNCQNRFNDGIWWLSDKRFQKVNPSAGGTVEITLTETVTRMVTIKITP